MTEPFVLSPRYCLDDPCVWLEGIDPARNYWIFVNGDQNLRAIIPGLNVSSLEEWKATLRKFRELQPQETMEINRAIDGCKIHCISSNCYAVEITGTTVWHLFEQEALESLLRTSHPDWLPSQQDLALGRELLARAFAQPAYA